MDKTCADFHRYLCFAGVQFYGKKNWNSKKLFILQIFCTFVGFLVVCFTSMFVLTNTGNLELMIQGACIWTTGMVLFISLGICLVFKNSFRNFLVEMAFKDTMMEMPYIKFIMGNAKNGKMFELRALVISSQDFLCRWSSVLLKAYVAMVCLCCSMYVSGCVYLMTVRTDESLRMLAFDMWFPWSLQNFKVYVGSFIFHAYAGYLCSIALPALQCTIILLVGQIIRQLKILKFILGHLSDLVSEMVSKDDDRWDSYSSKIFIQTIDHYTKIKSFSNRLNIICQPFYLMFLLVSIILVCVCSVKIAVSANKLSLEVLKYYVHQFIFIFIVFVLCLLGQEVENECEELEEVITNDWLKFNRSHKTNIKIFQVALGQRMPLYIFGTVKLNLPTFTWFAKTGSSFFTLMMSVLEEN